MLTDCYPPRLGGIESQVRDLSAPARARRARGRGVHRDRRPARRTRRCHDRGDDGVTVHRLAIPLPGGIPVNPFAPPRGAAPARRGRLRRRARPPRRREPVRHRARAGRARRRPAGHRHLPLRHRPLGRRVPRRGPPRPLGARAASRSTPCRRWRRPACRRPRAVPPSRWCPTAWMPRGGAPADRSAAPTARATQRPTDAVHVVSAMRLVTRKRPVGDARRAARGPGGRRRRRAAARDDRRGRSAAPADGALPAHPRHATGSSCPGRVGPRGAAPAAPRSADAYLTTARLEAFGIAAARGAGRRACRSWPRAAPGSTTSWSTASRGCSPTPTPSLTGALAHLAGDPALRARMRAHLLATPPAQDWPRRPRRHALGVPPRRGAGRVITVVGRPGGGSSRASRSGHGEDPDAGLAARGWQGRVVVVDGVLGDLTLRYAVQPARPATRPRAVGPGPGARPDRRRAGGASSRTSGSRRTPSSSPRSGCC